MTPAPTLRGVVRLPSTEPPVWWLPLGTGPVLDVGPSQLVQVLPTEEQVIHMRVADTGYAIDLEVGLTVAQVEPCGLAQAIALVGIFRCPDHVRPRWHALVTDAAILGATGHLSGAQGRARASAERAAADACDLAEVIRRRVVVVSRGLASGQVGHA